jgi:hypothetical protein
MPEGNDKKTAPPAFAWDFCLDCGAGEGVAIAKGFCIGAARLHHRAH